MFWDNFLWCTLGQSEGNDIYSLRDRHREVRNRISQHWLCEIGGQLVFDELPNSSFFAISNELGRGRSRLMERRVQSELRHYIVWFGKVRQKKRSQPADNNIAAHLTNYTFIADKVHKNPYISHYTLF